MCARFRTSDAVTVEVLATITKSRYEPCERTTTASYALRPLTATLRISPRALSPILARFTGVVWTLLPRPTAIAPRAIAAKYCTSSFVLPTTISWERYGNEPAGVIVRSYADRAFGSRELLGRE